MTGWIMVVTTGKDSLSEGGVGGDIDTAFVGEDPFGILPVRQTRAKGGGNGSIHRLKCLENKWVRGGGRLDTMGEGHVNEIDKE